MKKTITFLFAFLLALSFAQAQTSGGPDTYGYTWRNSNDANGPVYNWIDISTKPDVITVSGLADDNIKGPFPLNIPFHYYWYDPATFWIGSNGFLGFTATPVAHPFPMIPSTSLIQNYLAAMTCDLTFTDNTGAAIPGAICRYWQGTDSLIISWEDVPFWDQAGGGYTGSNSFQLILSTVDSSITYQFAAQNGVYQNPTNYITIGIENNSGSIGLQYLYDILPLPGTAVKFYYPATVTLAINDAATSYSGNEGTRAIILSKDGNPHESVAEVRNAGNQLLTSFNSYSRILNSVNQLQVRDTVPVANLAPATSQVVNYPDLWSPVVAGTYRQINVTLLTGDATPSNNQKDLEIVVVDTTLPEISLSYDNGVNTTNGISWSGGGGGIAMHFIPPFYPCLISKAGAYIIDDPGIFGYSLMIFDDDGPNGGPQTLLDSIYIAPGAFVLDAYNENALTQNIQINDGGFYVAWMMGGDGVLLGEDGAPPFSNRCFEVLGAASNPNAWAEYRNGEISDPIIHAVIITLATGLSEMTSENAFGEFYPNPAAHQAFIPYSFTKPADLKLTVFNMNGQLVNETDMGHTSVGKGNLQLDLGSLDAGIYTCRLQAGDLVVNRMISVVK